MSSSCEACFQLFSLFLNEPLGDPVRLYGPVLEAVQPVLSTGRQNERKADHFTHSR